MKTEALIDMLACNAGPAPRALVARRLAPAVIAGLLASAWACAAVAHFALRYAALRGIRFRTLNARRGLEAAHAHGVAGEPPQRWSTFEALNAREATFAPDWALPRRMHLGASVQAAVAGAAGNNQPESLQLVEAALRDSALACAH